MSKDTAPSVDKSWFEEKFAAADLNQAKVASLLKMSHRSLLSKRLSGDSLFSLAECAELAALLRVPVDEVMRRAGVAVADTSLRGATVYGTAAANGSVKPAGRKKLAAVKVPIGLAASRAILISGGPFTGWSALYDPSSRVEPEAAGSLAIVTAADGSMLLGHLAKGRDRGRWTVTALSGELAGEDIIATTASAVQWLKA